jgi:PhnB protein
MLVQPYLSFEGRCDEAIEFYKKALGAEIVMLMRFKDMPKTEGAMPGITPGTENKVMHAAVKIGQSTVFMSDGRCQGPAKFTGISLSLDAKDVPAAERLFKALSEGGQVHMPLGKTFFSQAFGMVADCFGVMWMVIQSE